MFINITTSKSNNSIIRVYPWLGMLETIRHSDHYYMIEIEGDQESFPVEPHSEESSFMRCLFLKKRYPSLNTLRMTSICLKLFS